MAEQPTMIPDITVSMSPAQLRELYDKLLATAGPLGVAQAARNAINKTAQHAKTLMKRELATALGSKIATVAKGIHVDRATPQKPFATLKINPGRAPGLINFKARQNETGVMAKLFGVNQEYPHAFIRKGVGGNSVANSIGKNVVFLRQGAKRIMTKGSSVGKMRQPLVVLKGPTLVAAFLRAPGVRERSTADMASTLQKQLNNQVLWLLSRGQSQPEVIDVDSDTAEVA